MCGSIMREFDITPKGVTQRHLLDLFAQSPEGLRAAGANLRFPQPRRRSRACSAHITMRATTFWWKRRAKQTTDWSITSRAMTGAGIRHGERFLRRRRRNVAGPRDIHSWNGKFRRPRAWRRRTTSSQWSASCCGVRGLTSYWAEVLATRAGLETEAQLKDRLALYQAELDQRTGRNWRTCRMSRPPRRCSTPLPSSGRSSAVPRIITGKASDLATSR